MKNQYTKFLETFINEYLKTQNFQKKGNVWYRETKDLFHLINLRRLQWGDKYFIDIDIYIKQPDNKMLPKLQDCQIAGSLEDFYGQRYLGGYLDFLDSKFTHQERKSVVEKELRETVIPFLDSINDLDSLKKTILSGKMNTFAITLAAKKFLGIEE